MIHMMIDLMIHILILQISMMIDNDTSYHNEFAGFRVSDYSKSDLDYEARMILYSSEDFIDSNKENNNEPKYYHMNNLQIILVYLHVLFFIMWE